MEDQYSMDSPEQSVEYSKKWRQGEAHRDYPDDEHSAMANMSVQDNLKNNSLSYQTQKIIINDAEEDESTCYKNFFDKDKPQTKAYQNDENEKPETRSPQRWELLYEKAKEARVAKNELIKEFESQKDEDPECTFKPRLISAYHSRLNGSPQAVDQEGILPFHERSKVWKERVDSRVTETRETHKDRDLHGCTFRPDILKTQGKEKPTKALSSYGAKGIDQFLRRQIIAKHSKEEKDTIRENPLRKLPSHVYKKTGNITIPKAPGFYSGKSIEINSLKKPFEFPTPSQSSKRAQTETDSPRKCGSAQKESQTLVDPIHIHSVKFGTAIQKLHSELQAFDIDSAE